MRKYEKKEKKAAMMPVFLGDWKVGNALSTISLLLPRPTSMCEKAILAGGAGTHCPAVWH
jgi:hypothetical protein